MKAFVTGATGFIGRHVVRKLVDRGYDVFALTGSEQGVADLISMGAHVVLGDISHVDSMRDDMRGSDVVFHTEGWDRAGSQDWMNAEAINVAGTRNVLRLAHELGVPKIIYTSAAAVLGNTKGRMVDETFFQGGPFPTEYERTKWLAHYKVALPLIEKGAPIIILMPGGVYGPNDPGMIGDLMRAFYQGRLPAVPGPDFVQTYAHVEDIAEGHILAAEKGRAGESYILAGPAIPLGEMVDFWAQLTGKPSPLVRVPSSFLQPIAPVVGGLNNTLQLPQIFSEDAIVYLGMTYMASADKAREELGWRPRTLQEGMTETFQWIAENYPVEPILHERGRRIAGFALLTAAAILLLWLLSRRQK
jgi:nucleoside-diphosphate-sugar epimerase